MLSLLPVHAGGGAVSPQRRPTEKNAAEWYLAAMREARRRGRDEWMRQCAEASSDSLDLSTNRQIRTGMRAACHERCAYNCNTE